MITANQLRAARALLNIDQRQERLAVVEKQLDEFGALPVRARRRVVAGPRALALATHAPGVGVACRAHRHARMSVKWPVIAAAAAI